MIVKKIDIKKQEGTLKLEFAYTINVSKEGIFSTTLPKEIVSIFQKYGIQLSCNRLNNPGYFSAETLDDLKEQVNKVVEFFFSRELINEEIIIKYQIGITCSYCKSDGVTGDIVPNGRWVNGDYHWFNGNIEVNATNQRPYGIIIYAKPFKKLTYRYIGNVEKEEYETLSESDINDKYYLNFLNSFCGIIEDRYQKKQEILYTEQSAKFFVDLIVSICQLNDKVKDFLHPDGIIKMIENRTKLLK